MKKSFYDKLKNIFSSNQQIADSLKYTERQYRIQLYQDHEIYFEQNNKNKTINLTLINISLSGIAFALESFLKTPLKGDVIFGSIFIKTESFPVELDVIYTTSSRVGCKFTKISNICKNQLSQYFYHELTASKLYPLNSTILKPDPDGETVSLMGEDSCELHYVKKGELVIKFNLTIMGNYLEVDKKGSLCFGTILPEETSIEGAKYKGSNIIQKTNPLTLEIKLNIMKFIKNIEKISDDDKNQMIILLQHLKLKP